MKVLRLEHTEDLSHLVQTTKVLREKNYITNAPKSSNFRSTIGSNPTSKQKSSSGTSSTYSRTAMATGAVVGDIVLAEAVTVVPEDLVE